jgi:lipoprotein Spr
MNNLIIKLFLPGLFGLLLSACGSTKKTPQYSGEEIPMYVPADNTDKSVKEPAKGPVKYDPIQVKYGQYLKVTPATIKNAKLYYFIDKWLKTPYKWGGMDERGIDCSAFLQRLLAEVYMIRIPRTSVQQFFNQRVERFKSAEYLSEGDLVFFRTMENKVISHVGLYLHNNMFVNSSSSKGVSIASLKDPYWKSRYVAAGRVKVNAKEK